jgi:hypothetical protein
MNWRVRSVRAKRHQSSHASKFSRIKVLAHQGSHNVQAGGLAHPDVFGVRAHRSKTSPERSQGRGCCNGRDLREPGRAAGRLEAHPFRVRGLTTGLTAPQCARVPCPRHALSGGAARDPNARGGLASGHDLKPRQRVPRTPPKGCPLWRRRGARSLRLLELRIDPLHVGQRVGAHPRVIEPGEQLTAL